MNALDRDRVGSEITCRVHARVMDVGLHLARVRGDVDLLPQARIPVLLHAQVEALIASGVRVAVRDRRADVAIDVALQRAIDNSHLQTVLQRGPWRREGIALARHVHDHARDGSAIRIPADEIARHGNADRHARADAVGAYTDGHRDARDDGVDLRRAARGHLHAADALRGAADRTVFDKRVGPRQDDVGRLRRPAGNTHADVTQGDGERCRDGRHLDVGLIRGDDADRAIGQQARHADDAGADVLVDPVVRERQANADRDAVATGTARHAGCRSDRIRGIRNFLCRGRRCAKHIFL